MRDSTRQSSGPVRLGILLSGGGRTLVNLLELLETGGLDVQVVTVIASRKCGGIEVGARAKIPTHLVSYKDLPDAREYSGKINDILDEAEVDLVVLAGFLSKWYLPSRYAGKAVNIHPALLPSFGGKGMFGHHVHDAVLASGCKVSGATVHFVTNEYDSGPIICQQCVNVLEGDTSDSLAKRIFEVECELYPYAIGLFAAGKLQIEKNVVRVLL